MKSGGENISVTNKTLILPHGEFEINNVVPRIFSDSASAGETQTGGVMADGLTLHLDAPARLPMPVQRNRLWMSEDLGSSGEEGKTKEPDKTTKVIGLVLSGLIAVSGFGIYMNRDNAALGWLGWGMTIGGGVGFAYFIYK